MEEAIRSKRPTLINAVIDEGGGTESGRITSLNPTAKKKWRAAHARRMHEVLQASTDNGRPAPGRSTAAIDEPTRGASRRGSASARDHVASQRNLGGSMKSAQWRQVLTGAGLAIAAALAPMGAYAAWEPTKPVEFVVPAGTGGGADQMARFLQGVIAKHNLMKQPIIVVNKSGGAGAEGFLDVKGAKGDPHKIDHHAVEPVHDAARHRRAVQLEGPDAGRDAGARRVRAVGQRRDAVQDGEGVHRRASRPAPTGKFKMGGTGSKQEDQIITVAHREGGRQEDDLRAVQGRRRRRGAARRQAHRLDGQQPDRGGRALARGRAAPAVRVRQQAMPYHEQGDGDAVVAATSRPASRRASTSST